MPPLHRHGDGGWAMFWYTLPATVTLINIDPPDAWICLYDELQHTVRCTRNGGPVGDLGTILISVTADTPGIIQNVCVSDGGPTPADDDACFEETTVNGAQVVPIPALNPWSLVALVLVVGILGMTARTRL